MKNSKKRASIFIYTIILINISLIIWYVVYNNTYILDNNINIWKNAEEVFSQVLDKANINIETVKKYNSNWNWFLDWISCPTNITMSWSTQMDTWISSNLVYDTWNLYCDWIYNWEDFRVYFDPNINDFYRALYKWEFVDLEKTASTDISVWTSNISLSANSTSTSPWSYSYRSERAHDWGHNSMFYSDSRFWVQWIRLDLWSERSIWKIIIRKTTWWWKTWNNWNLLLQDSSFNTVETISLSWMKNDSYREIDLKYRGLTDDVRYIRLEWQNNRYLKVSELEVYELLSVWWEEVWQWESTFSDSDNTLISFTSDWIVWTDWIDDDLDSDNYRVTSYDDIYFLDGYQDDDVVPRLTIFWNVAPYSWYHNVYWNNYLTNDIIHNNTNNDDILNVKASVADSAYVFIDLFNREETLFDIKIIEFDRDKYENEFTLLPLNTYYWLDLEDHLWYIQLNWNDISFSKEKSWNEFEFNFRDKDYWIFLRNKVWWELAYRISAETSTWKFIYINPIDDSLPSEIKSMSNHIIIGWEKNYIWENFTVVWSK